MIDSIEITNWKTHKKTRLDFQKGVNVLIGVMGAGKSSAMDAVCFCLFGTFPALQHKRVSLSELIMSRPSQETGAEIKLSFTVGDDKYIVTRRIGKDGNSAVLERNGQYLQAQPTKVTEEIESILKVDYDTFSRVVYSEQNQLDYFLGLAKGPRKKEIDHMLGLDAFALAEENTTSLINRIKDIIRAEEEAIARSDEKELREQLEKIKELKEKVKKDQALLLANEKKSKIEAEEAKTLLDTIRKKLEKKRKIAEELNTLQGRCITLINEIKKLHVQKIDEKALGERRSELERDESELKEKIDENRKAVVSSTKKVADLEASMKMNKRKAAERDSIILETKGYDISMTKRRIEEENRSWKALTEEAAAKRGKTQELNDSLKELGKHISKCPVCERELAPELKARLISEKGAALESLEKEIKGIVKSSEDKYRHIKELNELQGKLAIAESKLSEYKNVDKLIEEQSTEHNKAKKELETEDKKSEKLAKEYDTLREQLSKIMTGLQSLERKKGYESELMKNKESIEAKSGELVSMDVDDKSLYDAQEKVTKHSAEYADISSNLKNSADMLVQIEVQEKDKEKQVKVIEDAVKKIAVRHKHVQNLNKFKSALVETGAMLRNKLVTHINNLMQGLWPQLYPYGDYSSIKLDAKKDDYLLEVNAGRNGEEEWIQVDGIASGGERSVGCLAMRIALAMVTVPNLRWLILDEPTHNIDSAGISKMIEILGEELPNMVEQIFIITHEDELKRIPQARVYTLERDKGANAPTSASVS